MSLISEEMRTMLDDSVERFVQDHYDFESRKSLVASEAGYSSAHWGRFAELGWLGIPFAEEDDGLGGGIVDTLGLMRRFGRALVVEPYLGVVGLAGRALAGADEGQTKASLLPALIAGEVLPVLAWEEPGTRGNPDYVTVTAEAGDGGWRLSGEKITVLNAPQATHLIVSARHSGAVTDCNGIDLFVMPADSPGVSITGFATIDGHRAGRVRLDGAAVEPAGQLVRSSGGAQLLRDTIQAGCFMAAAEALGIMETLLDKTVTYTQSRKQFGQPIAQFQVLQHRMVDMYLAFKSAENLFEQTVAQFEHKPRPMAGAMALLKARIGRSARYVGQQAIQLHGGIGMTDELDIGHYFKRLTALEYLFGDADFHLGQYWREIEAAGA